MTEFQKDEDEALRYFLRCVEEFDFFESRIAAAQIYQARKDKTALRKILLPAVDRNDPEAMLRYGESYMGEDDNIVFEYYKKVSDMPVASVREDARWILHWAYFKLEVSYYLGSGCTQDRHKGAVILYQMADNGFPMAIDAIKDLNIPRP